MNKNGQQRLSVASAMMRVEMRELKEKTVKYIPSFLDTFKKNRKQNIKCGKIVDKSADHTRTKLFGLEAFGEEYGVPKPEVNDRKKRGVGGKHIK